MKTRKKQLTQAQRRALLPIIFVIGAVLVFYGYRQNRQMMNSYSVTAEIVGYQEVEEKNILSKEGETVAYYPQYRYTLDNKEITTTSSEASLEIPKVGEKTTIQVSPDQENTIVLSGRTYVTIGIVFIVFSTVMIILEYWVCRKPKG